MAHGPIAGWVGEESLDAFANRKDNEFKGVGAGYVSERRNVWNQPGASNQKIRKPVITRLPTGRLSSGIRSRMSP